MLLPARISSTFRRSCNPVVVILACVFLTAGIPHLCVDMLYRTLIADEVQRRLVVEVVLEVNLKVAMIAVELTV